MARPAPELAGIFRQHGAEYREAHRLSREQLRVMRAVEICRTAALGGHVGECGHCGHIRISYNSCRNRHCPKCQNGARAKWLADRTAEVLPVDYFHVVFTVPRPVAEIAFQNPGTVYDILFGAASETLLTIGRDPRHLGADTGFFAVLHTWGQNLLHHPHVHCVVPGGGVSPGGERWIACMPGFYLPVRVLSRLFRRLFLERLDRAFLTGRLRFSGELAPLAEKTGWDRSMRPLAEAEWVVYAKPPFGGPGQVIGYLGRYTHRVAIGNQRLISTDGDTVTFQWKDYRHRHKQKSRTMTLSADEFIRRFLMHVLPPGFQRIRYFGFLANCHRSRRLPLILALLSSPVTELLPERHRCRQTMRELLPPFRPELCPRCGTPAMHVVEVITALRRPSVFPADSS